MSLHSKKLALIESILKVEEESVLYEVKAVLKSASKKKSTDKSDDDLVELLNISAKDHKKGNTLKQEDLRKLVKTWKKK